MKRKIIIAAAIFALALLAIYISQPDASEFRAVNPKKTALMLEREAAWKAKGRKVLIDQRWVKLKDVSPYLVKAVIISEDDKFWEHEGFDYEALKSALQKDLKEGRLRSGGSTISQQLVKNLYLTPKKSFIRKAREALITWKMERVLTKSRILELYLNIAEWGDGVFGVQAASRRYFNKDASELTPMEAARLAVALPSPKRIDPAGDGAYMTARAQVVYDIMARRGIIEPDYGEYGAEIDRPLIGPVMPPATDGEPSRDLQPDKAQGQGQSPLTTQSPGQKEPAKAETGG